MSNLDLQASTSNPAASDAAFEPLHPNARWTFALGTALGWTLPLLPGVAVLLVAWDGLGLSGAVKALAFFAAAAAIGAASWSFGLSRFRCVGFRLDEVGLHIRRGVIWRSLTLVPRSRVQHTDVNRGPLDRRLGLSSLRVHTAGTKLASISLDGLPAARALELRDALSNRAEDDV